MGVQKSIRFADPSPRPSRKERSFFSSLLEVRYDT